MLFSASPQARCALLRLQHPEQLHDRVDAPKAAAAQRRNHQGGVPGMEAKLAADGGRLREIPAEEGMAQRKIET